MSERVKLLWRKQEMVRRLDRLERNILDRMGKNGKMWMISADCDREVKVVEKMKI